MELSFFPPFVLCFLILKWCKIAQTKIAIFIFSPKMNVFLKPTVLCFNSFKHSPCKSSVSYVLFLKSASCRPCKYDQNVCYKHLHLNCMMETCILLGDSPWALVTLVKAIRVGVRTHLKNLSLSSQLANFRKSPCSVDVDSRVLRSCR